MEQGVIQDQESTTHVDFRQFDGERRNQERQKSEITHWVYDHLVPRHKDARAMPS